LQARIAAAIREEQVATAKAGTKRSEVMALRHELQMAATQAASRDAHPLGRRAPMAALPAADVRPVERWEDQI
jgi:hypothetical protein